MRILSLTVSAAALIAVVRVQPTWWQSLWGPAADPMFAKLVDAVGEERYIEARLTGGAPELNEHFRRLVEAAQ